MPYKYDAQGNIVTVEVAGKKVPVFVNAKGEEAPFDADGTVETISRLNGEAKAHREAKEAAQSQLKAFEGITDPAAAKKALELTANLDAKKLVDAGEIDRVRSEIGKAWEAKLTDAEKRSAALADELFAEKVGGAFARSPLLTGKDAKVAVPVDLIQARFGANFGIEDGKVYAVDGNGQKIYSPSNPGLLASFDEALEHLINAHPQKDLFLKGSGASGGGSQGGGQGGNKGGGGQQGNLAGNRAERQSAVAGMFPDLPRG